MLILGLDGSFLFKILLSFLLSRVDKSVYLLLVGQIWRFKVSLELKDFIQLVAYSKENISYPLGVRRPYKVIDRDDCVSSRKSRENRLLSVGYTFYFLFLK